MDERIGRRHLYAVDWSGKGIEVTDNGTDVTHYDSLEAFLPTIADGSAVVIESTFHSFEKTKRHEAINHCAERDIVLLVLNPRATELWRRLHGRIEKTNENDVRAIYAIVREGVAFLKVPVCRCADCMEGDTAFEAFIAKREEVAFELIRHRYSGTYDVLLQRAEKYFGTPKDLRKADPELHAILCDGTHWRKPATVTVVVAGEAATSRNEFERLLGLYSHGYPSIMRSNMMYWTLGNLYNRTGKALGLEKEEYHNDPRPMKDARRNFRRQLRKAYHIIKQGKSNPATDRPNPA